MSTPAKGGLPRLFGRHKGKRLRQGQQTLIDDLLPRLRVPLTEGQSVDPAGLFGSGIADVWLEIGFGGGEHLAAQAAAHPDVGLIGCEFFLNGIAKLLRQIETMGLANVRIHDGDARRLIDALPPASIGRAFLLFPDPWPKARHVRRRFVQAETLDALARVLRPRAEFRFASDIPDYVRWVLLHMRGRTDFEWLDEGPADWRSRRADWPGTRYEAKAMREGRRPVFLTFRRSG